MLEECGSTVIAAETALLRDGELLAALDLAERKAPAAAQRYQRALEDLKASAVAIGRFAPPSRRSCGSATSSSSIIMNLNMAVLGTAKTVSESIIRELATAVAQAPLAPGLRRPRPARGWLPHSRSRRLPFRRSFETLPAGLQPKVETIKI